MNRTATRLLATATASRAAAHTAGKIAETATSKTVARLDDRMNPGRKRRASAGTMAFPSLLAGGALMYFFDPQQGSKRRGGLMRMFRSSPNATDSVRDMQQRSKDLITNATKQSGAKVADITARVQESEEKVAATMRAELAAHHARDSN